jgi:hypothetical protein
MRSITFVVATFLLFGLQPLAAQDPPLEAGARVRVSRECISHARPTGETRRTCRWDTGTLSSSSAQAVVLSLDAQGTALEVPLDSLTVVEVSRGRKASSVATGAVIGLLVGAGVGGGIVAASGDSRQDFFGTALVTGVVIGGGVGLLGGALIGATAGAERWEDVPLDRFGVGVRLLRGRRFGLRASIRF